MMEKVGFLQEVDERVKSIPLPNQMPKGIDITELPASALKSSTLESLISQNEDLMARLSVALRKNNEMEGRAAVFERELANLRTRFETLKDQYMILQEKDRMSWARSAELHEQNVAQKEKIAKLEKSYADIFVQAAAFQRRMERLERYRARVKRASKSRSTTLAAQVRKIGASYEARLAEARDMVDALRDKANERDKWYDEAVRLENALVLERRQFDVSRADTMARLQQLEGETSSLRKELKENLVSGESTRQEVERLRAEIPHLRDERVRLTEQVESLQALWNHKQVELELTENKNKSLQKLNQNISVTLNQQRRELAEIKTQLERERFLAADKAKAQDLELQLLRQQLISLGATPKNSE